MLYYLNIRQPARGPDSRAQAREQREPSRAHRYKAQTRPPTSKYYVSLPVAWAFPWAGAVLQEGTGAGGRAAGSRRG